MFIAQPARSLVALGALLCCLVSGCEFDPIVRPIKPQRVLSDRAQLLTTLDRRGKYVAMRSLPDENSEQLSIVAWEQQTRCALPAGIVDYQRPLQPPRGSSSDKASFYLPLLLLDGLEPRLVLFDERCRVRANVAAVQTDTIRVLRSAEDERDFLTFRDGVNTLWLLDPFRAPAPRPIADDVRESHLKVLNPASPRDTFWLLEGDQVALRAFDGSLIVAVGADAQVLAVSPEAPRFAFTSGDALYEAVAPRFEVHLIANDACEPRYEGDTLAFFSPCARRQLQKHKSGNDELISYEDGVFSSLVRETMTIEYAANSDGVVRMYAQSDSMSRRAIPTVLREETVTVLDAQHIAGIDEQSQLGIWSSDDDEFYPLFQGVRNVTRRYRGRTHESTLVVLHDMDEELGSLSVLDGKALESEAIAHGVPDGDRGGYVVAGGGNLPGYTYKDPLVVVLDEASRVPHDPQRFQGRLRALAVTGKPSSVLAAQASSFVLVASPMLGILYTVEDGPDTGVWFAAL